MTILLQCVHNNACNKPLQMYLLPNKMYTSKLAWFEYPVSFINSWLFYSVFVKLHTEDFFLVVKMLILYIIICN